jgi:para-nitrobenzyl esterase
VTLPLGRPLIGVTLGKWYSTGPLLCSGMTEITTPRGRLLGTTTDVDSRQVRAFRGVSYATAARFASPARVTSWTGTRDATAFGPAAPQPVGGLLDGLVPGSFRGSTDEHACLTLNVWTPADESRALPVLVWFPGGAFTIGATSQPVYDGARFCAEQDVVLVTCNYRLGALGFLDTRDAGGVANCGLRDAVAALEWVRDNIEAFGGDPERVTVFGESAGGGMVLHLSASPRARGLFRGAIVQSGATFNTLDENGAARVRDALLAELSLPDTSLADVPVAALLAAQSASAMALLSSVGMMPYHPMVDGEVLTAAPAAALAAGSAADIPMVIGTTTDEMRLFVDVSGPPPERAKLCRRVARYTGVDEAAASAIVATYEAELSGADTNDIWATLFTDVEMQQPAAAMRDAQRAHGPVFSYLFGWSATNPLLGACHGIDIPFTFGNFTDGWAEFVGADNAARALSSTIRNAWAAFARDGDPGWPPVPTTMRFDRDATVVDDPLRARLASLPQPR